MINDYIAGRYFIVLFDGNKAEEMCSATEKCTAESGVGTEGW